jgi:hypothetical protein
MAVSHAERRCLRWASAFLPAVVFLSSCSETTPLSPRAGQPAFHEPDQRSGTGERPRIVALKVENNARLLPNRNVEVEVRAFCRRGYEVTESGPLALTQPQGVREAYGEGFLRAQLGGCNGRWDREKVVVQQFEEPRFRRGPVRVSVTFAVVRSNDPSGEVFQVSVVKRLKIR